MKRLLLLSVIIVLLLPGLGHGALPGFMLKRMGTMSGQVFVDGQPLPDAVIAFFLESKGPPPLRSGMTRIPEFLGRLDSEGRFSLKLAAGKYYIGMLRRNPAEGPGPPRPGEKYYFATAGPGELRLLAIADRETVDAGRIDGAVPESFAGVEIPASFTVDGRVLDETGAPLPGAVVLAKQDLNTPRPEFLSTRTGEDGKFVLTLPAAKSFFLVARETIAGARPRPGQRVGTYGIRSETGMASPMIVGAGGPPPGVREEDQGARDRALPVRGAEGETIAGIEIFMYRVPDPEAVKASIQGTPGSPKFETGASLNNVFFAVNSLLLDQKSFAELDRWVAFLQNMVAVRVEIGGHTDDTGPAEINLALSEKRAEAVMEYLVSQGIARDRLTVKGYGEARPLADNTEKEGRRMNRRVEIRFLRLP